MRQGKASGGSSSTNSPEGEVRGKLKASEEEKGKSNTTKVEQGEWALQKVEKDKWTSPKEDWNSPKVEKVRWKTPKEDWNSPKGNSAEEHKEEWDSLVQHMDRKSISLKISVPPRPEDKKRKKLRRDVKR